MAKSVEKLEKENHKLKEDIYGLKNNQADLRQMIKSLTLLNKALIATPDSVVEYYQELGEREKTVFLNNIGAKKK